MKEGLVTAYELKDEIMVLKKEEEINSTNDENSTTNLTITDTYISSNNQTNLNNETTEAFNEMNNSLSINKLISAFFSDEKIDSNEKSNKNNDLNNFNESNSTSVYKSKNEKIKDYLIYAVAGVFLTGIIVIIWKKGV